MKRFFVLAVFLLAMIGTGCDSLNTDDGSNDAKNPGPGGDQSYVVD